MMCEMAFRFVSLVLEMLNSKPQMPLEKKKYISHPELIPATTLNACTVVMLLFI